MQVILQADQRPKQNHKNAILQAHSQELFFLERELGLMYYLETMMQRLNSGESKTIFGNIPRIVLIGLTTGGRKAWQEEEDTRTDFSIVLILQDQ